MPKKKTTKKLINGKFYPLWSQFVEGKKKWIGGTLEDFGDHIDKMLVCGGAKTKITNITLKPNSEDSAYFQICGAKFSCGFDVDYGGICAGEKGWVTFGGYGGHVFRIKGAGGER